MIRRTLSLLGAALVTFHAWVLGDQIGRGVIADPALAVRWLLAGALVAALVVLRRRGVSIVWGRRAVAIWSLAALLHGPAILSRTLNADQPQFSDLAATLAQVTIATIAAAGVALLAASAIRRRRHQFSARVIVPADGPVWSERVAALLLLAPRPPPAS